MGCACWTRLGHCAATNAEWPTAHASPACRPRRKRCASHATVVRPRSNHMQRVVTHPCCANSRCPEVHAPAQPRRGGQIPVGAFGPKAHLRHFRPAKAGGGITASLRHSSPLCWARPTRSFLRSSRRRARQGGASWRQFLGPRKRLFGKCARLD